MEKKSFSKVQSVPGCHVRKGNELVAIFREALIASRGSQIPLETPPPLPPYEKAVADQKHAAEQFSATFIAYHKAKGTHDEQVWLLEHEKATVMLTECIDALSKLEKAPEISSSG